MAGTNARQINESELRRQRKENQAIVQLMMIVGSFLLGYVPIPICGKQSWTGFALLNMKSNYRIYLQCNVRRDVFGVP